MHQRQSVSHALPALKKLVPKLQAPVDSSDSLRAYSLQRLRQK
jgi:hypothetical protein